MKYLAMPVLFLLGACATDTPSDAVPVLGFGPDPTTSRYTEPVASGLVEVRRYPTPDDVCVVVGENDATAELLDHDALLIGCPKHEKGAIADRRAEGAEVVAHARHWTLLSIPGGS